MSNEFLAKEETLVEKQESRQRNMHEECSNELNDAKGKIMNVIESIGLSKKQEEAVKSLIKQILNYTYQGIDISNREYVRTVYEILRAEGIGEKYLTNMFSSDEVNEYPASK